MEVADTVSASIIKSDATTTTTRTKVDDSDAEAEAKSWIESGRVNMWRGHDLTATCVALRGDGERALSGSKDNSVILWDVETEKKMGFLCESFRKRQSRSTNSGGGSDGTVRNRNDGEVLAVAYADDGRYAAIGKRDATVVIYDVRLSSGTANTSDGRGVVAEFKGHKGPVTSLAFRSQSNQLFSASEDRCIRYVYKRGIVCVCVCVCVYASLPVFVFTPISNTVTTLFSILTPICLVTTHSHDYCRHYSLDEMAYLETLYGHQAAVTAIDCHRKERPLSVGRDRTARGWKLTEDTHLIFRGGASVSAADCLTLVRDDWFVTGHDDGNLSMWYTEKKRAVATIGNAHGVDPSSSTGRGVQCLDSLKSSDLAVSGSYDGYLRFWRVLTGQIVNERDIRSVGKVPVHGFINSVSVGPKARFCLVAVGQEPRLGRWLRVPRAKNRIGLVRLRDEN